MKLKKVLVTGTNFENKGAQLMLVAIVQQLAAERLALVMGSTGFSDYQRRAKLGLYQLLSPNKLGLQHLWRSLPPRWRQRYGLVMQAEIDVVLDAAGYGFTEVWGIANLEANVDRFLGFVRQGKKVILLPQAFGPFTDPRSRIAVARLVRSGISIFARDQESLRHLRTTVDALPPSVALAPDFTNLVARASLRQELPGDVFFTLNMRVIDAAKTVSCEAYLAFAEKLVEAVRGRSLRPFLLIHEEGADVKLTEEFGVRLRLPVVSVDDPVEAKAIIGACRFGFSSRFHAVVSALSQAVPCFTLGWAHKYERLLDDYGMPGYSLHVGMPWEQVEHNLVELSAPSTYAMLATRLDQAAARQKDLTRAMWAQVRSIIGD